MTGNNFAKIIERQASRPLSQQWYDWIRFGWNRTFLTIKL